MKISVALTDANILISRTLREYFVYAAKLGALDLHWSETILDETTRNLIKQFDFSQEDAEVLIERLEASLPAAMVEVQKRDQTRVAKVEMDDKDRHVLATADLRAGARDSGARHQQGRRGVRPRRRRAEVSERVS